MRPDGIDDFISPGADDKTKLQNGLRMAAMPAPLGGILVGVVLVATLAVRAEVPRKLGRKVVLPGMALAGFSMLPEDIASTSSVFHA